MRVKLQFQQQSKMVQGDFDLYFGNPDSDCKFEDPDSIVWLWYWVYWLFVQWHETVWL